MSEPRLDPNAQVGWGRGRLVAVLAGVVALAVLLVGGLAYAVRLAVGGGEPVASTASRSWELAPEPPDARVPSGQRRDRIAAAPMMIVTSDDMRPSKPTAATFLVLEVPLTSLLGPQDVTTGYPRTPEGAVAQLAAIEGRVLPSMSLTLTRQVYDAWALPNPQVPFEEWELTRNVQAFLGATGSGTRPDPTTTVTATPAAGLVKGTDGTDWVLACVLLEVHAIIHTQARIGYGHCERMQWVARTAGLSGRSLDDRAG